MTTPERDDSVDGSTVAWRQLLGEVVESLRSSSLDVAAPDQEARWLIEEASGLDGADLQIGLDEPATVGGVRRLDAMVARRLAGEPLQYVLGRWSFRQLDLLVDRRALIPRPETEQVVEVALVEVDRVAARRPPGSSVTVVDLGTGSGAIALAIATERTAARVWATDVDDGALAVARANLAGTGRAAARVALARGSWFDALPDELVGAVDVLVSNPPYVPDGAALPVEVARWEPGRALFAGRDGVDDLEHLLDEVARWLVPGGAVVLELAPDQARPMADRAARLGLVEVRIEHDLAGRQRALVARRPSGVRSSGD